ncbi:MAG: phage gp6-like head-tail connector protein [Proteobacteria bacterium]|nr:phage gp6-like head-tail connector protein [Pseudomonadota bacterium]
MSIISLADVKAHMNVTVDDDDALIQSKIAAAEEWVGNYTGKSLSSYASATPPAEVPESLKEAVRQLVAWLYQNREASIATQNITVVLETSPGLFDLMRPHREWVF